MKDDGNGPYFEANPALCPGSVGPRVSHFPSIAVSDSTGAWGDSWSADSRAEADRAAVANCKERAMDCCVVRDSDTLHFNDAGLATLTPSMPE
jgi:hypothetical protein